MRYGQLLQANESAEATLIKSNDLAILFGGRNLSDGPSVDGTDQVDRENRSCRSDSGFSNKSDKGKPRFYYVTRLNPLSKEKIVPRSFKRWQGIFLDSNHTSEKGCLVTVLATLKPADYIFKKHYAGFPLGND